MHRKSANIALQPADSCAPTKVWPGLIFVAALSLGCIQLAHRPIWPFTDGHGRHLLDPVSLSILAGLLVGNVFSLPASFCSGIKFTAKRMLALGIILLGARLDFSALLEVGLTGILLSVCVAGFAITLFAFMTPLFGLSRTEGTLLGVGTAICGGTAIIAVAPLLKARDETVVVSVATVTLLGLVAMLAMPPIAALLALTPWECGVWTGLTIHQTPQVIAAGFAYGTEAGQTATVIKLARVCLLAPVAFGIGLLQVRKDPAKSGQTLTPRLALSLIPGFVLGFLSLALARTVGLIPDIDLRWVTPFGAAAFSTSFSLQKVLVEAATFLLAMSMAAVGLETNFAALLRTSMRPVAAAALGSLIIGVVTLAVIKLL